MASKDKTSIKSRAPKQSTTVVALDKYIDRVLDKHDEASDLKAYDFSSDGEPGGNGAGANNAFSEEIKAWADMATLESLFFSEDWIFILVDLVAGKISSQDLLVMQSTAQNGVESVEYNDTHPLNALIANPNPLQDYHSWMYNTVVQYALLGNAIEWYSKSNNWLLTLRTAMTSIQFNVDGSVKAYKYGGAGIDAENKDREGFYYDPSQIIHIRRPNPASLWWGLSPFVPGRKSILFNRYSTDYLNSFYLKQATPGLILEMDRQVNEQQALRQLRSVEIAYTGRKNQRRTMILPKGVAAKQFANSIADQRLTDLVNMNRETIMNLLRVPKHELGLQTAGSLGSEEYKIALRNFWESTLIPTMRLIEGGLNKFFADQLGPNNFFMFDLGDVEALKDDLMKKATIAKEMLLAGLSINEVRTRVWEEQPVVGAQYSDPYVVVQLNSKIPAAPVAPPTTAPTAPQQQSLDAVAPATTEATAPATTVVETATQKLKDAVNRRRAGWVDGYVKGVDELVKEKQGKDLKALALDTLVAMAEKSAPVIKKGLVETKAADIPSKAKLRKEIGEAVDSLKEQWVEDYTATLESVVELGYDQMASFVVNKTDADKLDVVRGKTADARREQLAARGLKAFAYISETKTEEIMAEIERGVAAGSTVGDIGRAVAEKFADPEEMLARADTIARTETLTAASIGQGAAIESAKTVIPGLKKAWLNADDSRVRDSHLDQSEGGVSGEVVDADEDFSNGLRWPRDVSAADPSDVINCRCTTIMIPPGEE